MAESDGLRTPPPTEPKPERSGTTKILNVKIRDQEESETIFKIKTTTKLSKVFQAYADKRSLDVKAFRFLVQGTRVQNHDTPESLDMVDGDEIQAMLEQTGGDGTPAPDEPKADQDGPKYLNVKVVDQQQNQIFFKIKENTQLKKVMDAYCERQGIARDTVRFLLEGERLTDTDTPLSREMEDQDTIEVFGTQIGGAGDEDDQPKDEDANKCINIRLVDQNHHEVTYKVKLSTKMEKVMDAFATGKGQTVGSLRFFAPDGKRVLPSHTAGTLELEDGDLIDVHLFQEGGAAEGEEEAKDEVPNDRISITVKMGLGMEQTYKVKGSTKMTKVMNAYCQHLGRQPNTLRFFTPDGKRINENDTPTSLGLEDGDLLDAHEEQKGGAMYGGGTGQHITVKVVETISQDAVYFTMKTTTKMAKLIAAYEQRESLPPQSTKFSVARISIQKNDTPLSLHLQNGATIHVNCAPGSRANESIIFCVEDVLGNELWFKTKLDKELSVVMDYYCKRVQESVVRFETSSGQQIQSTDTPKSIGLLQGCKINSSYVDLGQVTKVFQESLGVTEL